MRDLWVPYACNLLRGRRSGAMWPNIDKDGYQSAGNRHRGQPYWHEPPPDPSFHRRCRSSFDLLMRLHEKRSLPAVRAFGQVRQHPLLFPRGGCTLHEHTELASVGMARGLEISGHPCPYILEFGSASDSCSNLRKLMSKSLGSVPSASSAARRLRPRCFSVRRSCLRRRSVARLSLRLMVAS